MSIWSKIFGTEDRLEKLATKDEGQMQLLQQLMGMLQGQGGQSSIAESPLFQQGQQSLLDILKGGDEAYKAFADPYMKQYQEEILPMIRERYGSSGPSSSFEQALAQSAQGLGSNLASLRESLKQQAIPQALGYSQAPAQQFGQLAQLGLSIDPFAYQQTPGSPGALGYAAQGFGKGFGGYLASGGNPLAGLMSAFKPQVG